MKLRYFKKTQNFPIKEVFKTSQLGAVKSFFSTWILTGCVVISVLLTPNLLSKVFELSPISKVVYQVIAIFFLASGNVFAGVLSDRIGIKNASAIFGVALVGFALCFYYMLGYGKGLAQYFDVILLVYYLMAFSAGLMVFTPIVMVQSFPAMIRYSGISFAYNLSYALFGGLTPIFFAWAMESDWIIMLGVYMSILGILAIVIGRVHRG